MHRPSGLLQHTIGSARKDSTNGAPLRSVNDSHAKGGRFLAFGERSCLFSKQHQRLPPHPTSQLPRQPVRRPPVDADEPAMNAVQVVRGAERDEVRRLVAPAARAEQHVVRVHRRPAAAGDLAEALVAIDHALLRSGSGRELLLPSVDEVLRHPHAALVR
jgi:hypothetical protein